jgi:hypothetical protein
MMRDMVLVYQEKELRARTKDLTILEAWATMHSARCTTPLDWVIASAWEQES